MDTACVTVKLRKELPWDKIAIVAGAAGMIVAGVWLSRSKEKRK